MNERIARRTEDSLSNSLVNHFKTQGSISDMSMIRPDLAASQLSSQLGMSELHAQHIGHSKLNGMSQSRKTSTPLADAMSEVERDLSDLPQAKSQMMANFENHGYRPPNVYRQTLNVDNLIAVCSKKLADDPLHRKALFIRASSYLKKGHFEESIDDCVSLMQLDGEHAGAFYVRGCAYEKLDMVEQAISDFTRVLQIDGQHINAAYARGACENKRGNFAKAIDDYNMALAIDKDRSMSPFSNNRRMPFRATSTLSGLLDTTNRNLKLNASMLSAGQMSAANHTSMISGSNVPRADGGDGFFGGQGASSKLMSPNVEGSARNGGFLHDSRTNPGSVLMQEG